MILKREFYRGIPGWNTMSEREKMGEMLRFGDWLHEANQRTKNMGRRMDELDDDVFKKLWNDALDKNFLLIT